MTENVESVINDSIIHAWRNRGNDVATTVCGNDPPATWTLSRVNCAQCRDGLVMMGLSDEMKKQGA